MKGQNLDQVFYDLQTARNVLQHLSDEALFDSCAMDIQVHQREDLDGFYEKLVKGEKLTREERKQLESFYILTSVDFLVNE
jgi:uncharacterized coiled-coil DUF342 family protein